MRRPGLAREGQIGRPCQPELPVSMRYIPLSVAALISIGILLWSLTPRPDERLKAEPGSISPSYALPQALSSSYRVLRASADQLIPKMVPKVESALSHPLSDMETRSRRITTPLGAVWVTVADLSRHSTTCLIEESSGASTCAPTKLAARLGLAIGTRRAGSRSKRLPRFSLIGIVPNWVKVLKAKEIGHRPHLLPVRRNVYATYGGTPVLIEGYCRATQSRCAHPPLPRQP